MDRSLDDRIAERQRTGYQSRRDAGPPRRGNHNFPRDGVRKSARDDRANLDNDWVHDRYDDEPAASRNGHTRTRPRRDEREDRLSPDRDRAPPPAKIRVENLHYDLTEDDVYDLFTRIAPVTEAKLTYDRAGRSDGTAFITYDHIADARTAIREFDGANAKGQPIRLTLLPPPRRDLAERVGPAPRSLFDRIEPPGSRNRRRSQSPMSDPERRNRRDSRRGTRGTGRPTASSGDRRSDVTKPPPENIDRYVPGQSNGRSSSSRGGGRRPGERRERVPRESAPKTSAGRPRKTAEELDAEMEDYWGNAGSSSAQNETGNITKVKAAASTTNNAAAPAAGDDDIDMIE